MTTLKPQDIVVLLKLVASKAGFETYAGLAREIGLGLSQVYRSLERSQLARLYDETRRQPIRRNLREFVIHGVPYAFPAERGQVTRGLVTSYAAPPLADHFSLSGDPSNTPVWPDAEGTTAGYALFPLHPTAPAAARKDAALYELLALVDALREGRARERKLAAEFLEDRLS